MARNTSVKSIRKLVTPVDITQNGDQTRNRDADQVSASGMFDPWVGIPERGPEKEASGDHREE
jgi:hypothetical protein